MFKEISGSFYNNLNDRIKSPFYGSFIVSWCVWNWKVLYITFFVDSNLLLSSKNILKIDYIRELYTWNSIDYYTYGVSHLLIFPLVSSYVVIYWIPKMTSLFYEKSLENENKNREIKLKKDQEFLKRKEEFLEIEKKVLKKEAEVEIEKVKTEKTQEKIWDEEYDKFKETKYFQFFNQLKSSIYSHSGRTFSNPAGHRHDIISADMKAYLDANKIIDIGKDKNGYEIATLTEKGKHFMKKYTSEEKL